MKIAVLAGSRHPLAEPFAGGQESHTATLIAALRHRGHFVRLHAPEGTDLGLADEFVPFPEPAPLSATAALDPQIPEADFLENHHRYLGAIRDLAAGGPVDVIHNQSLHHLPLTLSAALPAPLVTTLHTPPFPWMEVGVALAAPGCRYVTVSEACAQLWTTLPQPATVVPNGVDDRAFSLAPGGPDLLWVGRLTPEKGADLAIAAARAAGRQLVLAGPISNPDWFSSVIAPLLGPGVRHVGHLTHAELSRLYGRCAALVFTPRWEEPFGLVAVESAMSGTPVIAVGRGGLADVVDSDMGVVVPSGDDESVIASLAQAIAIIEALPREAVRRSAIARFGADHMAQAYERIYRESIAAW